MRLARSPEQFDHELRYAVLEELAHFYQLDDGRREQLGLPPLSGDFPDEEPPAPPPVEDEEPPSPRRRRRKKKRMLS